MYILLIIIIILAVIITVLVISAIRIRFTYEESEKTVRVSYTLAGIVLDLAAKRGRFLLAGLPVVRFPLKPKAPTKVLRTIVEPKGMKKDEEFSWKDIRLDYLKRFKSLIGSFRIPELIIKIRGGFKEPFHTGKMYGYYWAMRGIYPNLMSHVDFKPDFSAGSLQVSGKGLVYLRMYDILYFVFTILNGLIRSKTKRLFNKKK